MGTLVSSPTAVAAFDGQLNKKGLDLNRSVIRNDLGTEVANPTATIRAGMLVTRDSSGFIAPAASVDIYGIAKWGKSSFGVSVHVDEAIVLTGTSAISLLRGNVSNVTVRSAPAMAGTVYAVTTDYTLSTTNGTVTRVALGTIADGQTVYVTYTYALVDADYNIDGRFWQNQAEDRTLYQDGRITVITGWSRVFTIEWTTGDGVATAPNSTYALTGANSKLYCSTEGKFTNDPTTGTPEFAGRVYQIPTASDPYMGVTSHGNPNP